MSPTIQKLRLGVMASHPIQYQAPIFRELAERTDLVVHFAHRQTPAQQAAAGFNVAFDWDADLLAGYEHVFLQNIAKNPSTSRFFGCNTPAIKKLVSRDRFDAFMVMGWNLLSYWQAVSVCRQQQIPVMQRGDSQLNTPGNPAKAVIKKVVYPWMLNRFDGHLYVGRNNRAYLQHYGVNAEKLFFAPHSVSAGQFTGVCRKADQAAIKTALGEAPGTRVLLFCGRMVDFKRPGDLLEVLAEPALRDQNISVWMAGDGPMRASLEQHAARLGVRARFLGFRNQSQLPELYTAADALVLPSTGQETWGLVVNEALACGTPVVVSDQAGCAPDMVIADQTGCTYPCGDIPAMAGAIRQALAIEQDSRAIHSINARYSVSATAAGIMEAANQLAMRNNFR